jgi:hypothetical protein
MLMIAASFLVVAAVRTDPRRRTFFCNLSRLPDPQRPLEGGAGLLVAGGLP